MSVFTVFFKYYKLSTYKYHLSLRYCIKQWEYCT